MIIIWFLLLVFLGPRFITILWWLIDSTRFSLTFNNYFWPILGIIFIPWTTLMYVIVAPGGLTGFDWLWLGLAFFGDLSSYAGGGLGGKKKLTAGKKTTTESASSENKSE